MKWILAVLIISGWDGHYLEVKKIASYNSRIDCEHVQDRLNTAKNTSNYLCATEVYK